MLRERCKRRLQLERALQTIPAATEVVGRCRDAGNSQRILDAQRTLQTILAAPEDVAKDADRYRGRWNAQRTLQKTLAATKEAAKDAGSCREYRTLQTRCNSQRILAWTLRGRCRRSGQLQRTLQRMLADTENAGHSEDAGCYRGCWTGHRKLDKKLDAGHAIAH